MDIYEFNEERINSLTTDECLEVSKELKKYAHTLKLRVDLETEMLKREPSFDTLAQAISTQQEIDRVRALIHRLIQHILSMPMPE